MKKQIIQIVSAFILFIIALCVQFENVWIKRDISYRIFNSWRRNYIKKQ